MQKTKSQAFTLVELIVVITILAILGTIAFVSFTWYARDTRNSTRVSDMKTIEKNLDLDVIALGIIPLPDESISVSYSGWLAWSQGYFWESARTATKRISNIPLDPIFGIPYTYSVKNNRRSYQLSSIIEWWSLFSHQISPLWETYALSNSAFQSQNVWNFLEYDLVVKNGSDCYIIAAPSIVLSDMPVWGVLENNTSYNYSYTGSPHIASSYSWAIENITTAAWFQNIEVFSGCIMSDLDQLKLYNAQLSTAYQQFADQTKYETLIFDSKSRDFLLSSIESLQERWIIVNQSIIQELKNPGLQTFTDSFTNTNGTAVVWSHSADLWGIWLNVPGWESSSYSISGNQLVKNDTTDNKIYPRANPYISWQDYTISVNITEFSGWSISLYLRYLDPDNYYRVELRPNWYIVYRNQWWSEVAASNVSETITAWSEVIFWVEGDSLALSIDWNPKWNIVLGWINGVGFPVLSLENSGASVDNFNLIYR